jgi:5-methylcytosine-specific restriction enzyme A
MATHQRWYDSARWRRKSKAWLKLEPLCAMCKAKGMVTAATVADHVVAHRGNERLFWDGELQALCRRCHSGTKQQLETKGFSKEIGVDGFPVDRNHPFWWKRSWE